MSGQAIFYPRHCEAPQEYPFDEAKRLAADLMQVIQKLLGEKARQPGWHAEALKRLATIFQEKVSDVDNEYIVSPQTSLTPTGPGEIRATSQVHG